MTQIEQFKEVANYLSLVYERKNSDYGNSYSESIDELGEMAGFIPIYHKCNRIKNLLINGDSIPNYESLADSVMDLASYAIQFYMVINNNIDKQQWQNSQGK